MRAKEIQRAAEELTGGPVSWSSVRNCLVDHLEGRDARFERVGRGRYRLRHPWSSR